MQTNNNILVAQYFLALEICPDLDTVKAALAAAQPVAYARQGDVVFPGVQYVDATNGLVSLDPAMYGKKFVGQTFTAFPLRKVIDPKSQATATIEWNDGAAKLNDEGRWLYVRVMSMTNQDSAARPWIASGTWIDNAWSIGSEFDTWETFIDHLLNHWNH